MEKPSDAQGTDRYRSWARQHAAEFTASSQDRNGDTILPSYNEKTDTNINEAGGLNAKKDGRGSPSGSTAIKQGAGGRKDGGGGDGGYFGSTEKSTGEDAEAPISKSTSASAPSKDKSEDAGAGDAAMTSAEGKAGKPPMTTRMLNGSKRFAVHMKDAICHSWINVLLVFIPIGIAAEAVGLSAGIVFGMNAVAIIPLAGLLAFATEAVAARLGDTLGALLNVSFGNAVELIIFIIALVKNEIQIVQASLLGSILANLLLILGMAFLFGGLRYREQIYNSTVTQMSACLLSLSVMSLLLPVSPRYIHSMNTY
jgi:Ca2+:H+ antiporter